MPPHYLFQLLFSYREFIPTPRHVYNFQTPAVIENSSDVPEIGSLQNLKDRVFSAFVRCLSDV